VRIYPDDIAIVTHEDELTEEEIEKGFIYWKNILEAGNDEEAKKTAWTVLVDSYGAPRSAWVAKKTKPGSWDETAPGGNVDDLVFPEFDVTKPDSWTLEPRSKIMPDRFVVTTIENGKQIRLGIGKQIPDPLICGPDPLDADHSIDQTAGEIILGEKFDWITDFDKAIDMGMGLKIPLSPIQAKNGFEKLYVLGIKWSTDAEEGQLMLQNLVKDHHYSDSGFTLLKQGAATNNTDETTSDFSENDIFDNMSYYTESNGALFSKENDPLKISDGQLLAEFLGIDQSTFHNIFNAGKLENAESLAMNRALYPGTLGYFLDSMMEPVFNDYYIREIRKFFTNEVKGRGPISAIRVGNQPYGILPASDFKNYKIDPKYDHFQYKLHNILDHFNNLWKSLLPRVAYIGKSDDPSKTLLEILGLHPNSVEHFRRVGYSGDYLKNLDDFKRGGKYYDDYVSSIWRSVFFGSVMTGLGYNFYDESGDLKKIPHFMQLIYQHFHVPLTEINLIDGNPFSEERLITPYTDNKNYIHWLSEIDSVDTLEKQDFGTDIKAPNYLLYLMLRHSLLLELSDNTGLFFLANQVEMPRYKRARDFINIKSTNEPTRWDLMKAKVSQVQSGNTDLATTINQEISVGDLLLTTPSIIFDNYNKNYLHEVKEALRFLANRPTAHLERAFIEHTDTLTYRLDAWQTGLFTSRLKEQRNMLPDSDGQVNKGIYTGAFGWLEDVKIRSSKDTIADSELPPELQKGDNSEVFVDPENGGYVHTPSLNHASAAALLRNAYLTHASRENQDLLSINLSSARIRNAMELIQGIRNGQSLEVLLGYQFERGMHDKSSETPSLNLNQYILDFRLKFPVKKQAIPQKGTNGAVEEVEDYAVVNGLNLAETKLSFPYGISTLSGASNEVRTAIPELVDDLKDSIDAIKDVLTSESAYHLSLGNFDKVGAALKTLSDSEMPTNIDGIKSQRGNEITFTNKVMLQFETNPDLSLPEKNPWNITPLSPRALLEPSVNIWLGNCLGKPEKILFSVQHQTGEDTYSSPAKLSLSALSIHPIDFIYMLGNELQSGATELELLISYYYRNINSIEDDTAVKINFDDKIDPEADDLTMAEIFPLALYLKKLITDSRALHAEDFSSPSKEETVDKNNPKGIAIDELINKASNFISGLEPDFENLKNAKTDFENDNNEANTHALREQLRYISSYGFLFSVPLSHFGVSENAVKILSEQAENTIKKVEGAKATASAEIVEAEAEDDPDLQLDHILAAFHAITGEVFRILPLFTYNNPSDIDLSRNNQNTLIRHAKDNIGMSHPVDEWISGISKVRKNIENLENIRIITDSIESYEIEFSVLQIPYKENDNWLAVELPGLPEGEEREILHNTVSIINSLPESFDPYSVQKGILIDDWVEVIPEKESVTGITMHYDQPNAEAPQTILLAVTPEKTESWKWEDLINIMDDTLLRSKQRAVEPDMIDKTGYGLLLPSIISEFSSTNTNISLDMSLVITNVYNTIQSTNFVYNAND